MSDQGIREDSPSVQSHLTIMQNVIARMATNSTACKTWCITIVSAILVVIADKGKPHYVLIAIIPTLLFFALDAYYLSLEKRFRSSYNNFIMKLHTDKITHNDLFIVVPSRDWFSKLVEAIFSISILPFYIALGAMIVLSTKFIK